MEEMTKEQSLRRGAIGPVGAESWVGMGRASGLAESLVPEKL